MLTLLQFGVKISLALSNRRDRSLTFLETYCISFFVLPVPPTLSPWNQNLVLSVLQTSPFEPFQEIPLLLLMQSCFSAITLAHRVSELAAYSFSEPFLVLCQEALVLFLT